MGEPADDELGVLRAQVAALLADALRVEHLRDDQLAATVAAHEEEIDGLQRALESRDLIGQAKGVIMAALHCTADEAFALLVKQSQAENRKLVDVAFDVVAHTQRHSA